MPESSTLFIGIGELATGALPLLTADDRLSEAGAEVIGPLRVLRDAAFVMQGGCIAWIGRAERAPDADRRIDLGGRAVVPGFVDSHAHLAFAGDRAAEFEARAAGVPYDSGGIRTTVAATRAASDDQLRANVRWLVGEMARQGTTTVECKTGYGLTIADEVRAIRIAREECDAATFLGAHVVPAEFAGRRADYVEMVRGPMLESCAPHADYIDVFCERGAFDEAEARLILDAAKSFGLAVKLHANQLGHGPGVQLAVEYGAVSADHCTHLDDSDIAALAGSPTVATLLPGADFSTRSPYPNARRLLDAGATVALATDCNPGSSYTTSMSFCIALAVREMCMTPAEALVAATLGGARALASTHIGHLAPGARADFAVLDAPSYLYLAYRPGVPLIHSVWKNGVEGHATLQSPAHHRSMDPAYPE
jgi:imidazolonepropionase